MADEEWDVLHRSYKNNELIMECCGMPCIPKVSHLGTRFFAHKYLGQCATAPETEEHLKAKWIIAKTALAAGWQANTEMRGSTPDGDEWIADVLCTKGNIKIAFEVQLANQTYKEFQIRQAKYSLSSVRGCWLVKGSTTHTSRELPIFGIDVKNPDYPLVNSKDDFCIALHDFIFGTLAGKLKWFDGKQGPHRSILKLKVSNCWKCKESIHIVKGLSFKGTSSTILLIQIEEFVDLASLFNVVTQLRIRNTKITPVAMRFSKTAGYRYLAAICPYCDSIIGNYFMLNDDEKNVSYEYVLTGPLMLVENDWQDAGWAWYGLACQS